ncbi:MAG: PD-(D/E)XK nuclease family protein, partial [Wujia sp.]
GKYRYVRSMLGRLGRRTAEIMSRVTERDGFSPEYFEYRFSEKIHLKEHDTDITIRGIVDRGDVKCIDNRLYLRIIDYKTGSHDFEVGKLYEGTQLQLAIYMSIMDELVKKDKRFNSRVDEVIPDGMYYYQMSDPLVDVEDISKIEKTRSSVLKLRGIDSKNQDKFQTAVEFAVKKAKNMAGNILDGDISINPIYEGQNPQCSSCPYKAVCRFDKKYGGNSYHYPTFKKNAKDTERAFQQIKEELGGADYAVD